LLIVDGVDRISQARGFTLVESVIACAVLATALLSIGHLGAMSIARVGDARHRTIATTLAVAKLEELRTASAPAAGGDVVDSAGQPAQRGRVLAFERRWSVTPVGPDAHILTVVVDAVPSDAGRQVRVTGGWMAAR
jgi:Tfp pilus assembly protein PilV